MGKGFLFLGLLVIVKAGNLFVLFGLPENVNIICFNEFLCVLSSIGSFLIFLYAFYFHLDICFKSA
jgi:hypothetical protein